MASAMKPASDDEMNYPNNEKTAIGEPDSVQNGYSVGEGEDILALQDTDPALNAKMFLVNNVRRLPHAPTCSSRSRIWKE
jgi:hypothetical protein